MTESNTVKLEPCPRCRSPFVEVQDAGRSPEHPYTTFRCAVCALEIIAPIAPAEAVRMWNGWDRREPMMAAAEGTAAMARAHALDTAAKPTRLERLVTALLSTGRVPGATDPSQLSTASIAAYYVSLAQAIEVELDRARGMPQ
jgi:hypothetical protein